MRGERGGARWAPLFGVLGVLLAGLVTAAVLFTGVEREERHET